MILIQKISITESLTFITYSLYFNLITYQTLTRVVGHTPHP